METQKEEKNHAIIQAQAHMDTIQHWMKAKADFSELEASRETQDVTNVDYKKADKEEQAFLDDCADFESEDDIAEAIHNYPLSVEVRKDWHALDDSDTAPDEYRILVSTGGPACQVIGDLDQYGQPTSAKIQWQDWGTPWTDLATDSEEDGALLEFAQCFYFGEG